MDLLRYFAPSSIYDSLVEVDLISAFVKILGFSAILGFVAGTVVFIFMMLELSLFGDAREKAGEKYEKEVAKAIKKYTGYEPLQNLIFQTPYGTTELDMVFVCTKGVFAIECKHHSSNHGENYISYTFDDEELEHNTIDSNHMKRKNDYNSEEYVINPFKQNKGHIRALKNHVKGAKTVYSLVYDSYPFIITSFGRQYKSKDNKDFFEHFKTECKGIVSGCSRGTKSLAAKLKQMPDVYTTNEAEKLFNDLKKFVATKEQRLAHKMQQEERFG